MLFALLAGNTAAGSRVYPLFLPEEPTLPAITYQQISSTQNYAMGGAEAPLRDIRVQINSWGDTYAASLALAAQVLIALNRYKGSQEDGLVLDILLENEMTLYESAPDARRVIQDYRIFLAPI